MKSQATWNRVKHNIGLDPRIVDQESLNRQTFANGLAANELLRRRPLPYQGKDVITIHGKLFCGIFDHAGEHSQTIQNFGPFTSVDGVYFQSKMGLLDQEVSTLWEKATSIGEALDVIAFQHARLIAIHGFRDGNGRTSRVILDASIDALSPSPAPISIASDPKPNYVAASEAAIKSNNLTPLANLVRSAAKSDHIHSRLLLSPYRISPLRAEEDYRKGIDGVVFAPSFHEQAQDPEPRAKFLQRLFSALFEPGRSFAKNELLIESELTNARQEILTLPDAVQRGLEIAALADQPAHFWQSAKPSDYIKKAREKLHAHLSIYD